MSIKFLFDLRTPYMYTFFIWMLYTLTYSSRDSISFISLYFCVVFGLQKSMWSMDLWMWVRLLGYEWTNLIQMLFFDFNRSKMKGHLYFVLRKNGDNTQYPGAWLVFFCWKIRTNFIWFFTWESKIEYKISWNKIQVTRIRQISLHLKQMKRQIDHIQCWF